MKYSIKSRFGAESREDLKVAAELGELLKVHLALGTSTCVFWIEILQDAE